MRIASRRNAEEETLNVHDTYGRISKGHPSIKNVEGEVLFVVVAELAGFVECSTDPVCAEKTGTFDSW